MDIHLGTVSLTHEYTTEGVSGNAGVFQAAGQGVVEGA